MAATELEVLQQGVAALEAESTRLRALLEATPDLVVRVAIDGTYRDVMEGRHMATIASRSERVGKKVGDLLPAAVAAQYDEAVRRAVSSGLTQSFEYELTLQGRQATTRPERRARQKTRRWWWSATCPSGARRARAPRREGAERGAAAQHAPARDRGEAARQPGHHRRALRRRNHPLRRHRGLHELVVEDSARRGGGVVE